MNGPGEIKTLYTGIFYDFVGKNRIILHVHVMFMHKHTYKVAYCVTMPVIYMYILYIKFILEFIITLLAKLKVIHVYSSPHLIGTI